MVFYFRCLLFRRVFYYSDSAVVNIPDRDERNKLFAAGKLRAFNAFKALLDPSSGYQIKMDDANEMRVPASYLRSERVAPGNAHDWFDDNSDCDSDLDTDSAVTVPGPDVAQVDVSVAASVTPEDSDITDELLQHCIPVDSEAEDPNACGLSVQSMIAAVGEEAFSKAADLAGFELSTTGVAAGAEATVSSTFDDSEPEASSYRDVGSALSPVSAASVPLAAASSCIDYTTAPHGKMWVKESNGEHRCMWIATVLSILSAVGKGSTSADRLIRIAAAATLNKKIDVSGGLTVGSDCAVWFEDRVWYGRVQRYGMFNSKSRSMKTFIAPLNLAERVAGVSIFFSWYDNAPKSCLVGTGLSESDLSARMVNSWSRGR